MGFRWNSKAIPATHGIFQTSVYIPTMPVNSSTSAGSFPSIPTITVDDSQPKNPSGAGASSTSANRSQSPHQPGAGGGNTVEHMLREQSAEGGKHSRRSSASSRGDAKKPKTDDWKDLLNIDSDFSPLSTPSKPGTPAPGSPAHPSAPTENPPAAAGNTSIPEEGGMHAQTWDAFYRDKFFSGGEIPIPRRPQTPSDLSSMGAEWHRIGRPDVQAAFRTLQLYDEPDANRERILEVCNFLLLETHPDHIGGDAAEEAKENAKIETRKIIEARKVALAYVAKKNAT